MLITICIYIYLSFPIRNINSNWNHHSLAYVHIYFSRPRCDDRDLGCHFQFIPAGDWLHRAER